MLFGMFGTIADKMNLTKPFHIGDFAKRRTKEPEYGHAKRSIR